MVTPCGIRHGMVGAWSLAFTTATIPVCMAAQAGGQPPGRGADTVATLGLDQGIQQFDAGSLTIELVRASQTVAALRPKGAGGFDFSPSDWLDRRSRDGFFHLGDLTLRLRAGGTGRWREVSTAAHRKPVTALDVSPPVLAAADLSPTLPAGLPLEVRRYWEMAAGQLALRFDLRNTTDRPVEIGGLGIPMVFNNILEGRSLDQAHAVSSFSDPYIGQDAGYV